MHTVTTKHYDLSGFARNLYDERIRLSDRVTHLQEVKKYLLSGWKDLYKDEGPSDLPEYTALIDDMIQLVKDMQAARPNGNLSYHMYEEVYNLDAVIDFLQDKHPPKQWHSYLQGLKSYLLKVLSENNVAMYKLVSDHVDIWQFALDGID